MKLIQTSIAALALASTFALAAGETPAAPAPAPVAATKVETAKVPGKVKTASIRAKYKEAKEECLKENASLKGKDLKSCVKGKIHN
ncbi:MAG: hypothetical protein JST16_10530 [Bdellovibrionales bacterium]|nr:hypothetical protein [Bdellovibrionales bacterium]